MDQIDRAKIFKTAAFLVVSIFFLNFLAMKFYLYYSIWYFDMIMHFLGGVWLGFFVAWMLLQGDDKFPRSYHAFAGKVLAGVIFLGVGWELYEAFVDYYLTSDLSRFTSIDTLSDIICDTSGGILAIYLLKTRLFKKTNTANIV